jgi:5-methylcytosine-specific restriction endonuclease McrA
MTKEKGQIIKEICSALSAGNETSAKEIARRDYPFQYQNRSKRKITDFDRTRIFIRDGFIDRYSGQQLIYPGTIMLLAHIMPDVFPYHANWKMSVSHIMFWELWPTIDHVYPIARGGSDDESNWVCTSMIKNSAKSTWTLEELGWQMLPPGDFDKWDGLIHWFVEFVSINQEVLTNKYVSGWYKTAKRCLA